MTYPPQSPEPHPHGAAPGPGGPGPQPGPAPDFAIEWGIKEHPGRPKQVNQLTQVLWGYFALSVLMFLFAVVGVATAPWFIATGVIVVSGIVGLVFHGLSIAIAWLITRERLGMFGAQDPRIPLAIGLGLLGLFSLGGLFGGWWGWLMALSVLVGLARLAAVGAAFYLLYRPEVGQWLASRPGNLPKPPVPPQHPGDGYGQPPATGQQAPPGHPNGR